MTTKISIHDSDGTAKADFYKGGMSGPFETLTLRLCESEVSLYRPTDALLNSIIAAANELLSFRRDEDALDPPVGGCETLTEWSEGVE